MDSFGSTFDLVIPSAKPHLKGGPASPGLCKTVHHALNGCCRSSALKREADCVNQNVFGPFAHILGIFLVLCDHHTGNSG